MILHGLLGSCENWRAQKKIFSRSYRVLALDLRNHGRSPHSEIFNFEAMADDLREFMDRQALETAHLLGHSLGGRVAMQFASNSPNRVRKLVVVDVTAKAYRGEHREILAAMHGLDLRQFKSRSEVDSALAPKISILSMRRFLLKNLAADKDQGLKWRINLDAIHRGYDATTKALTLDRPFEKPALFVRGEKSKYVEDDDIPAVKTVFPDAEFVKISGAGHWVHVDQPEQFNTVVLKFLGRNGN
jgi:esterase